MEILPATDNFNKLGRGKVPSSQVIPGKSAAYQGYLHNKNKVISSPGNSASMKIISPIIPSVSRTHSTYVEDCDSSVASKESNSRNNMEKRDGNDLYTKNHSQRCYSPILTEVNMPGGFKYIIDKDVVSLNQSPISTISQYEQNRSSRSIKSTNSQFINGISTPQIKNITPTPKYIDPFTTVRDRKSTFKNQSKNHNYRKRADSFESENEYEYESENDSDFFDSEYEEQKIRNKKSKRRNNKRNSNDETLQLLKDSLSVLLNDFNDRKQKEREEKEKEEIKNEKIQQSQQSQQSQQPSFTIPISQPVKQKKIPNYDLMNDQEIYMAKEKFRLLYRDLINKYPRWQIQEPNYDVIPLKLIHECYEKIIKTICIYQTAMKWKVYLVILFAGIEWYGYHVKKFFFLKDLLTNQIKTIHKYDNYLIDFSEQFYSDDEGDDWPLWMRFLGTLFSGLICFSSVNGFANKIGIEAPPFVFEQADKFVSPPEGPAKLHSDGISEVPDPASGIQDPNNMISIIGNLFGMFTGGNKSGAANSGVPAQAAPPKPVDSSDDFANADF